MNNIFYIKIQIIFILALSYNRNKRWWNILVQVWEMGLLQESTLSPDLVCGLCRDLNWRYAGVSL